MSEYEANVSRIAYLVERRNANKMRFLEFLEKDSQIMEEYLNKVGRVDEEAETKAYFDAFFDV